MQQIMTQCFLAVKSKLDCRLGFFDLIGCDFMVDEDFKVCNAFLNILTVVPLCDCFEIKHTSHVLPKKGVATGDEL